LLKRERIRPRTYITRGAARQDVFDYIEMFYKPIRKHTNSRMLSPVDYETEQRKINEAGFEKTRSTSALQRVKVHDLQYLQVFEGPFGGKARCYSGTTAI